MIEICKGDLVARERRNLLSPSERTSLSHHLATCASCRLSRQIGADFDAIPGLQPGDDARLARIAAAVSRSAPPRHRIPFRVRGTALLVAAAIGLLTAGAFGARVWLRRTSDAHLVSSGLTRPPEPSTPIASTAPVSIAEAPVAMRDPTEPDSRTEESSAPGRPPAATSNDASAAAMFAKANQARHDGAVETATTLYRRLEQKFPASPEARLSCISLGRLLLDGGRAALAMEQFDRYLAAPGGQLAAEALAGRARALGMLDRPREERDTWNRLLREFPGSVYAARARQRLADRD